MSSFSFILGDRQLREDRLGLALVGREAPLKVASKVTIVSVFVDRRDAHIVAVSQKDVH